MVIVQSTLDVLSRSPYLLVTTFRRDGREVATPVWVAGDDGSLVIWTPTDSGKVKRIRRSSKVLVAACDVRGRPTGEQVPGRAVILDGAGTQQVRDRLRQKYGLIGRLTLLGSRLRRGLDGTVGIRISLLPQAD